VVQCGHLPSHFLSLSLSLSASAIPALTQLRHHGNKTFRRSGILLFTCFLFMRMGNTPIDTKTDLD
jgi:hypothetical protein